MIILSWYQLDSSCVIRPSILVTTVFYKPVILQGEIWRLLILGLKGLLENPKKIIEKRLGST